MHSSCDNTWRMKGMQAHYEMQIKKKESNSVTQK